TEFAQASRAHRSIVTWGLRVVGVGAGGHWNIRRDLLCGVDAHTRDRHKDGVGRAKRGRLEAGAWPGNDADVDRHCDWPVGGVGIDAIDEDSAVWRERDRSSNLFYCIAAAGWRCVTRLLSSGEASNESGSDGRAAA